MMISDLALWRADGIHVTYRQMLLLCWQQIRSLGKAEKAGSLSPQLQYDLLWGKIAIHNGWTGYKSALTVFSVEKQINTQPIYNTSSYFAVWI